MQHSQLSTSTISFMATTTTNNNNIDSSSPLATTPTTPATPTATPTATATPTTTTTTTTIVDPSIKNVHKRYEGLLTVRTKAIKGKGAWYWAHLEPILLHHPDSNLPKAVKLRCSLCLALFSASNPSRTASEHLKRGTCPNFTSPSNVQLFHTSPVPKPISSIPPPTRKRSFKIGGGAGAANTTTHLALLDNNPPVVVDASTTDIIYSSSSTPPQHFLLSGGKDDLGALALLEDSVKKLKSPKASPGPPSLSRSQVDSALSLLSDWFYDLYGSFSFSSLDNPKFRAFLHHVGLPPLSRRELAGAKLDSRYDDARADADARIRDAMFFQVAADGFKSTHDGLVSLAVNLPNGTTVFRRAVLANTTMLPNYAAEILLETVTEISGGGCGLQRCVGIVADRFESSALRNLESQNQWMVNLSCQLQGVGRLVKDLARELPLFATVVDRCRALAHFLNTDAQARRVFHKYQMQELDHACLLRTTTTTTSNAAASAVLEDIIASARPIQLTVHDDTFKMVVAANDQNARELGEMVRGGTFWTDLEAIRLGERVGRGGMHVRCLRK